MAREQRQAVSGRFVARAADLGFTPPPVAVRLKILRAAPHWMLFLQTSPPGPVGGVAAWLEPYSPLRLEFGSHHILRADFDPLPAPWLARFRNVSLDMLTLDPGGDAVVSITGTSHAVAEFAAQLGARSGAYHLRHVGPALQPASLLTPPQEEAVRAALAHGYYDIPRPINLHELAAKLGVSSASLSERLRRAEARIIRQFMTGGGSPWNERTLFDPEPLGGSDAFAGGAALRSGSVAEEP